MNIGVSLSPSFLCGEASSLHQKNMLKDGLPSFLTRLRKAGCTHIELRAVRRNTPPETVTGAVRAAQEADFFLTVHGILADEPAELFWSRFLPVLDAQKNLCVTVHSVSSREETLRLLRRMGDYALFHHPGAQLALENNRSKKGDNIDLVECAGVGNTVKEVALSNIGTCWDFGHFYWDHLTHPNLLSDPLPPEAFLKRAVHTHIHSVCSDTTHFPLTMGKLPLKTFIHALKKTGYSGVYNLEPEPERWDESTDAAEEIIRSVELLRNTLQQTEEE